MKKNTTFVTLAFLVFAFAYQVLTQTAAADHEHMVSQTCSELPAGQKRPEFGCFIVASSKGLQFDRSEVYWHLERFSNRAKAQAAKSPTGLILEEEGKIWVSEFGPDDAASHGGELTVMIGPLELPYAKSYHAQIAYAVLRPGDRSRVHTHAGPEAWYMLSGDQCLETPSATKKAKTGETMSVEAGVPMELSIIGTNVRRSFTLVIHDSAKAWGDASDWKPTGACGR
jgi:quercetin dioxygenase-like cupin family protein